MNKGTFVFYVSECTYRSEGTYSLSSLYSRLLLRDAENVHWNIYVLVSIPKLSLKSVSLYIAAPGKLSVGWISKDVISDNSN